MIKNFFKAIFQYLREWLIIKLGGYTEQQAEIIRLTGRQEAFNVIADCTHTVFSQVDLNEYPSLRNDPKNKCYELTCKQLGKAIYPYVRHIYADNGMYTAVVDVLRRKYAEDV